MSTKPGELHYEWTEAGALLHIDAFELPKFDRPGHWATGQRAEEHKTRQAGRTVVIGVLDDHSRLTYCELHADENAATVTATSRAASTVASRSASAASTERRTRPHRSTSHAASKPRV